MKKRRPPTPEPKLVFPLAFPRADPAALAQFDPRTKVCTMNCGQHSLDPRSPEELRFLCDDCLVVKLPMRHRVEWRKRVAVNTDPQRRCYDGCNFSEAWQWTAWSAICTYSRAEDAAAAIKTFQSINARDEYRVTEVSDGSQR